MVGLNSNFCWGMGKPEPNASFCPSVFAADKMFLWNFVANRFGTPLTPQSGLLSLDVDEYAVLSDQAQTGSGAGKGETLTARNLVLVSDILSCFHSDSTS